MSLSNPPSKTPFQWQLNWKVCLFTAVFLPLLCSLGFWQLARAEQKLTLQQTLRAEQAKPALDFSEVEAAGGGEALVNFREVKAAGEYLKNTYWLVENKTHRGQIGYEVLMPFQTEHGVTIIVNRGWVVGTGYREQLPVIETPLQAVTLNGWLAQPSKNALLSGATVVEGWPKLILEPNITQFEQDLKLPLWPQILQLVPHSESAFISLWQPINMSAAKHQGYAVQWFSMAFILCVLTIVANSNILQWLKRKP